MSVLDRVTAGVDAGVMIATGEEALSAIRTPGCAASIWHRTPLPSFQDWIDTLPPETLPKARLILQPEAVSAAVEQVCESCGTPAGPERARLIDDIAALADGFAQVMATRWLRLRLDVVRTDACRRFHVDAVTARLVCTYRGTGTQYGFADACGEPCQFETVRTGSPILLRGILWPKTPATGLLHRSPPIEGSGEVRLLLVLDPLDDPDDAI